MIYISDKNFKLNNTAVTLGKFDGVHLGHKLLLDRIISERKLHSVMFTFDLHPSSLLTHRKMQLLFTNEEKRAFLEPTGLEYLIAYPFTKETAALSPEEFVRDILVSQLDAKLVVVGKDFCFGHQREGNVDLLRKLSGKYGFELVDYDKVVMDGEEVSSTRIRRLISEGDVAEAGRLLGRRYNIRGKVIHGNGIGNSEGMPTANVELDAGKLLPKNGVYSSYVTVDGKEYKGITNIGVKPTVSDSNSVSIETFILGFSGDLYNEVIDVSLVSFIREEKKFASLKEVKQQVEEDIYVAWGENCQC